MTDAFRKQASCLTATVVICVLAGTAAAQEREISSPFLVQADLPFLLSAQSGDLPSGWDIDTQRSDVPTPSMFPVSRSATSESLQFLPEFGVDERLDFVAAPLNNSDHASAFLNARTVAQQERELWTAAPVEASELISDQLDDPEILGFQLPQMMASALGMNPIERLDFGVNATDGLAGIAEVVFGFLAAYRYNSEVDEMAGRPFHADRLCAPDGFPFLR